MLKIYRASERHHRRAQDDADCAMKLRRRRRPECAQAYRPRRRDMPKRGDGNYAHNARLSTLLQDMTIRAIDHSRWLASLQEERGCGWPR